MADSNDQGPARMPKKGAGLGTDGLDRKKYLFGEDEEVENRKNTGRTTPVQDKHPNFQQIGPSSGNGNLNESSPLSDVKSGNMKFSGGAENP